MKTPVPSEPSPVETSTKKQVNLSIIVGALVILVAVVVGVYLYLYLQETRDTSAVVPIEEVGVSLVDAVPQEKALYSGTYEGKEAIFYTNPKRNIRNAKEEDIPYIGFLDFGSSGITVFDYRDLTNPKRIASLPFQIEDTFSFKYSEDRTIFYIGLIQEWRPRTPSRGGILINSVYAVDLRDSSAREIWENEVGSDRYESKGAAQISEIVDNKFVVLVLYGCYGCHAGPPIDALVVNIATKNETYLGRVGDIKINVEQNTVSYRNLAPFIEDCEPVWDWCTDKSTVMRPVGETYTKQLNP